MEGRQAMTNSEGESLAAFAASRGVKYFLICYADLFGVLRSKLVPSSAIEGMQRDGAGFAGYATHLDMTPADPDMFAIPDPSAATVLPWKPEIAWVPADLYMNGQPVAQAPRNVLKAQIAKAREQGLAMKTGVECEFFLLCPATTDGDAGAHSQSLVSIADAQDVVAKPCYDQGALMRMYDVISTICDHMGSLGWGPYQNDHEDGNGQFEMNWDYSDCLVTADRHAFFKFMAKSVAQMHGMRASFMPKPFATKTGNGAHCHVSVWDLSNGSNLFQDGQGELGLSEMAYHFIGGVLSNAKALCALTNSTVNSFKRIDGSSTASGSSWAPATISYTGNNRTHMIRIPDSNRFELRLADGAVNPYLLQAGILASGLDGIASKTSPGPRSDFNGHIPANAQGLQTLPENLLEAIHELGKSETLRQSLGPEFLDAYVKLKLQQWRSYTAHLSQWEIDNTLDC